MAFDDLHSTIIPKCLEQNTIHITTEPSDFFKYHRKFTDQFAWLMTHNEHAYRSGVIKAPPHISWFVGWHPDAPDEHGAMPFEEVSGLVNSPKNKLISIVSSNKTLTDGHKKRLAFAHRLAEHYAEQMDFYGRGFVPMKDKLESLQDYRFQVVIENSSKDDYFTEKVTDSFLAGTYPIYYGCKNLENYFPKNSFLQIDIDDFEGAILLIEEAISKSYDQKYRKEMVQAQQLCINKYNLFPALISKIADIEAGKFGEPNVPKLHAGKLLPFRSKKFRRLRVKKRPFANLLFFVENFLYSRSL